jgi:SAM-dependent methyltransferase
MAGKICRTARGRLFDVLLKETNMPKLRRIARCVALIAAVGNLWSTGYAAEREPDVRFVPTPQDVVMEMLRMARVTKDDVVYDLGCGDGRIVITAAKVFGARGMGVDIDPVRIRESNENAIKAGVSDRVKFIQQDLFEINLSEATVVSLYLLPELNRKLRPKLFRELRPGTRVVSHEFDMDDWKPDNQGRLHNMKVYYYPKDPITKDLDFYYWVIPAQIAGDWEWTVAGQKGGRDYSLRLVQKFQEIDGHVSARGRQTPVEDAHLVGTRIGFTVRDTIDGQRVVMRFYGAVDRNTIEGTVEVQGGPFSGNHPWTSRRRP